MFRSRQKIPFAPAFLAFQRIDSLNERGEIETKVVDMSKVVLPDVETTDISSLLAAGIDPKQVNTRILGAGSVVIDLSPEPEKEDEPQPSEGE